jgi:hypothetical protein
MVKTIRAKLMTFDPKTRKKEGLQKVRDATLETGPAREKRTRGSPSLGEVSTRPVAELTITTLLALAADVLLHRGRLDRQRWTTKTNYAGSVRSEAGLSSSPRRGAFSTLTHSQMN